MGEEGGKGLGWGGEWGGGAGGRGCHGGERKGGGADTRVAVRIMALFCRYYAHIVERGGRARHTAYKIHIHERVTEEKGDKRRDIYVTRSA